MLNSRALDGDDYRADPGNLAREKGVSCSLG